MTWRAFIGEWPGDYRTETDRAGLTWDEALDVLGEFAVKELDLNAGPGGCDHCAGQARQVVAELASLPEGTEWSGHIDWDELRLIREP